MENIPILDIRDKMCFAGLARGAVGNCPLWNSSVVYPKTDLLQIECRFFLIILCHASLEISSIILKEAMKRAVPLWPQLIKFPMWHLIEHNVVWSTRVGLCWFHVSALVPQWDCNFYHRTLDSWEVSSHQAHCGYMILGMGQGQERLCLNMKCNEEVGRYSLQCRKVFTPSKLIELQAFTYLALSKELILDSLPSVINTITYTAMMLHLQMKGFFILLVSMVSFGWVLNLGGTFPT